MGVVEVREIDAKKGVDPLHWVLYTHEKVQTFEDEWQVISRCEKRPWSKSITRQQRPVHRFRNDTIGLRLDWNAS